nr:TIM-barrel domain-containing protein [Sorangium cellulosum]
MTSSIIRVQYTTAPSPPDKNSLSVNNEWDKPSFCVAENQGTVTITTSRLKVNVDTTNGLVTYTDLDDGVILSEDSKTLTPVTVEGVRTNRVETVFNSPADEALFGLGQHQDNVANRKGTTRRIVNANTEINIPALVSNRGYGIFWDNYSASNFDGTRSSNSKYSYSSEAGDMVDYYFFYGPSIDQVVAQYRTATGAAPLFPKWAYGLFQSKDKYGSQAELLRIKDGYRNNDIPVDCIVQDWDYWTPYAWGSHFMDERRYPDPASLIAEMHKANVHTMISIWPVYQRVNTERRAGELDNFNALDEIGALYPSGGTHHFYDTFNPAARALVYQQIHDRLLGPHGWDGIWADNTEPQAYPDPVNVRAADTALGKGALYLNAYPLGHAAGVYEHWRSVGPKQKRVYVLTRSAFAGQQRYATTCWSGDIDSNFATYAKQIPAGLNFSLAGMPYWTTDIGVKAGSIVPMGPSIQYATQSIDPLEIRIYTGQDGSFTLYEDEGDSYDYEGGHYSTIPFTWSESARRLTIGARKGSYTGMPASRTFRVVRVGSNHGAGVDVTAAPDQVVTYDGSEVVVTVN